MISRRRKKTEETLPNHLFNNVWPFKPPNTADPEEDRDQKKKNSGTQEEFPDSHKILSGD
jgi:hypothetical protein